MRTNPLPSIGKGFLSIVKKMIVARKHWA